MILGFTLLAVVVNLALGVLVLIRRPRAFYSAFFLISVCAMSAWAVSNYIAESVHTASTALWAVRLAYFSAFNILLFFLAFSISFIASANSFLFRHGKILLSAFFGVSLTALTDLVVTGVAFLPSSVAEIDGVLKIPYLILLLVFFVVTIQQLFFYSVKKSQSPQVRAQLRLILFGVGISFIVGFLLNAVYPLLTNDYTTTKLGPISLIAVATFVAIAIVKHRLFDIRLIIARSLAYVFSLVVIAALYAFFAFVALSSLLGGNGSLTVLQEVTYVALALLFALTFNPLRRFFNKLTQRIFYRDAYDSQEVLDKISTILTNSVSVKNVSSRCVEVIDRAIKPTFLAVVVTDSKWAGPKKTATSGKSSGDEEVLLRASELTPSLVVVDELEKVSPMTKRMGELNAAVIAPLQTSKERIGFLVFGYKRNGSIYTKQDVDLVRIIADELAVALQNALRFEEISRFNETLTKEVQEATAQLRDTNRKLKKLDEIKDEFISMASHQLRTPLTSVKGYISMVLEGDAGPVGAQQKQLLEEAFTSAQRMVYLIGDFLNVSRLQTGKFVIEWKQTNLAMVVKEEVDQLRETATRHHIKLQFDPPVSFPLLQLDENKMRQVIMNFIDNAIFYTRPGGTVRVVLLSTVDTIRLEVHDNGIGVPEEERHKLFSKFFRADNARKVRPDGTGIGLFMAKKVVAAHGGSIIFESQEGKGSIFGFTLPQGLKDKP